MSPIKTQKDLMILRLQVQLAYTTREMAGLQIQVLEPQLNALEKALSVVPDEEKPDA